MELLKPRKELKLCFLKILYLSKIQLKIFLSSFVTYKKEMMQHIVAKYRKQCTSLIRGSRAYYILW